MTIFQLEIIRILSEKRHSLAEAFSDPTAFHCLVLMEDGTTLIKDFLIEELEFLLSPEKFRQMLFEFDASLAESYAFLAA